MGVIKYLLAVAVVGVALWIGGVFRTEPNLPKLRDNEWWGKGPNAPDDKIHNFEVDVPVVTLKDLKRRLAAARIGEDIDLGDGYSRNGLTASTMRDVVKYWHDEYDWRAQEKKLNSFPQYRTQIEGILIHFLDVPPSNTDVPVKTILMVHGWPGSVWEFYKIIPLLSAQGFRIIAPSIPGYGFSEEAHKAGFDLSSCARVFHKLMQRLEIQKYYLQGGDWGAFITAIYAQAYPQEVLGLHSNVVVAAGTDIATMIRHVAYAAFPSWFLDPEDVGRGSPIASVLYFLFVEGGYFHLQATKPHTIGFSLNDSPVGLAAYILEKFSTCTNNNNKDKPDGGLTEKFSMDELLTNVMIYWLSGCTQASMRLYKENVLSERDRQFMEAPVKVPTGFADFPHELMFTPESFARSKFHNIIQFTRMPRGGHFAAFEEPELLAQDFIHFVQKVEKL